MNAIPTGETMKRAAKGTYVNPSPAGPFKCTIGIPVDDDAKRGDIVYGPFGEVRITSIRKVATDKVVK